MAQWLNTQALTLFFYARIKKKSWLVADKSVGSIADLDPVALAKKAKAVIFDKDNTLTLPYAHRIHPKVKKSVENFKKVFKGNIAILSNSSGSSDDKNYKEAAHLEKKLGIPIIRHKKKKPECLSEVLAHFKCKPEQIIVIGDRLITDVVFAKRYGMHAILTEPLDPKDGLLFEMLRSYERALLKKLS